MRTPVIERQHRFYRFANDYGASVLRRENGDASLSEIEIVRWYGDICFVDSETGITDGVIGGLNDAAVDALLDKIEALPNGGG